MLGAKQYVAQSELGHMPRCIYSYTNPQNFGITTLGNIAKFVCINGDAPSNLANMSCTVSC